MGKHYNFHLLFYGIFSRLMTQLTYRALLTAVAMVLDQFARVATQIIITPLLISILGSGGFGLWQWFHKAFVNLSTLDGRGGETIKWYIATKQEETHTEWKQHLFGACLITYCIFLPIFITAIIIFNYFALNKATPIINGETLAYFTTIMALAMLFQGLASAYQGVLRGQNLGYKRMGINALIIITTASAMLALAKLGYGLIGLSIAQLTGSSLLLILNIRITRKHIPWLKPKQPSKRLQQQFTLDSFWMSLFEFISFLLLSGEIIVLGFFTISTFVSSYYITAFSSQLLVVTLGIIITAMLPGLAGIYGKNDNEKFISTKEELSNYIWLFATMLSILLVLFNEAFIHTWVGREFYAGRIENILIILLAWQLIYVRFSSAMLNITLKIKEKVIAGSISLVSVLILTSILVPKYSIVGLCASFLIGRAILQGLFLYILNKNSEYCRSKIPFTKRTATRWVLSLATISAAAIVADNVQYDQLFTYILSGAAYLLICFFIFIYVGWAKNTRVLAYERTRIIIRGK